MWIAVSLSIIGFLLIYLEFFMAGGVMALLGGVAVVGSATYFGSLDYSLGSKIAYFLLTFAGTALTCKLALSSIQSRKKVILEGNQEGFVASSFDEGLIGQTGKVATDLKPSGHILLGGSRHQALSEGEYLSQGTEIVIIGGRGAHLIVRKTP